MKTALITGITGQDGAYLAKFLLGKGYKVCGAYRRGSELNLWRLKELGVSEDQLLFVPFELLEESNIYWAIETTQPDEVYNLAAQTFVGVSFQQPLYTVNVNALGTLRLLEAVRSVAPKAKFYQASTSEMFGNALAPQREATPFAPRSPYGIAKVAAHHATVAYREAYGLHASCGILFNHESPLRGTEFVTRKITSTLARIHLGSKEKLRLGNLHARRDWGFAGDYVEAMWAMLQQDKPDDYVIATGFSTDVHDFSCRVADYLGMRLFDVVTENEDLKRPAEVSELCGNASKAKEAFGWEPTTDLNALVAMMVEADLRRERQAQLNAA